MQTPTSYEEIISKYDWPDDIAIKVATAESGLNPKAVNPEWHRDCQGSFGLFQMACIHYKENPNALYDPEFNVAMAYQLWKEEGWEPWSVCKNGKVDCGNWSK